eukprot:GHVU01024387.1.p1 GENE.GHVU01024387.1~~GHVU01024387.1.p1  ORF type:complete len:365 (+),score=43.02 GHVU01024387.1:742-1836(+)
MTSVPANCVRDACPRLCVSVGRESKKRGMVDNILAMYDNRELAKRRSTTTATTTNSSVDIATRAGVDDGDDRGANGGFEPEGTATVPVRPTRSFVDHMRLWNLAARDENAERLIELSGPATVAELQRAGGKSRTHIFWEDMAAQYSQDDGELGVMLFDDDPLLAALQLPTVTPTPHSWDKLQTMYKEGVSQYRLAQSEYTRSGTHQQSFFGACFGNLVTLYIKRIIDTKPGLDKVVTAHVPPSVKGDSTQQSLFTGSRRSYSESKRKAASSMEDVTTSMCPQELTAEKILLLKSQREYTEKRSRLHDDSNAAGHREAELKARSLAYNSWADAAEAVRTCDLPGTGKTSPSRRGLADLLSNNGLG